MYHSKQHQPKKLEKGNSEQKMVTTAPTPLPMNKATPTPTAPQIMRLQLLTLTPQSWLQVRVEL